MPAKNPIIDFLKNEQDARLTYYGGNNHDF